MEKFFYIIKLITSVFIFFPWIFYICLFGLFGGVYLVLIGPIIFKFRIIPRIEKRYGRKLYFNNPAYIYGIMAEWTVPPQEVSFYIFSKYIRRRILINRKYNPLEKIKYDINTATKFEVIMSCVSVFFFFATILSMIIFAIYDHYYPFK